MKRPPEDPDSPLRRTKTIRRRKARLQFHRLGCRRDGGKRVCNSPARMQTRTSRWLAVAFAVALPLTISGCQRQTLDTSTPASARALGGTLAGDPATLSQDDGQWVMPAKNYASTRFSGLDEINAGNVKHLGVAWTFSTGDGRGHEAAPLVVGDTMYVVTPFPNIVFALDLSRPGAPEVAVRAKPLGASQGVACCDVVNRGAAYDDGKIFFNTLDNHTIALDAATGQGSGSRQARRHQHRRDDDDGAARREGQGARRQQRRRVRRARLAHGARREHRARSPGAPTAPARTRTC